MRDGPFRAFAAWLGVMALTATALAALDRLPSLVAGTPPGVREFGSVEAAEQALGVRVWLPPRLPGTLRWPPDRVESDAGATPTVAVQFAGRDAGDSRVVLCQSVGTTPVAPPESLLPAGRTLETAEVRVGGRPASLARVLGEDGRVRHELRWDVGPRRLTLRSDGPVEDLLRLSDGLGQAHK
jgi:hypothetical protein